MAESLRTVHELGNVTCSITFSQLGSEKTVLRTHRAIQPAFRRSPGIQDAAGAPLRIEASGRRGPPPLLRRDVQLVESGQPERDVLTQERITPGLCSTTCRKAPRFLDAAEVNSSNSLSPALCRCQPSDKAFLRRFIISLFLTFLGEWLSWSGRITFLNQEITSVGGVVYDCGKAAR